MPIIRLSDIDKEPVTLREAFEGMDPDAKLNDGYTVTDVATELREYVESPDSSILDELVLVKSDGIYFSGDLESPAYRFV